jgi:hypothetical protein
MKASTCYAADAGEVGGTVVLQWLVNGSGSSLIIMIESARSSPP